LTYSPTNARWATSACAACVSNKKAASSPAKIYSGRLQGLRHHAETQKGVVNVEKNRVFWQDYAANEGETGYDYAMLIRVSRGCLSSSLASPAKMFPANSSTRWASFWWTAFTACPIRRSRNPDAWPSVYQNPNYRNILRPASPLRRPARSRNRTSMLRSVDQRRAAAHRHGVGIIGPRGREEYHRLDSEGRMTHHERMSEMFAACIASMGDSLWDGSAA